MSKNSRKGKFIVIEGIDGCGGETQTKKLIHHLKNMGVAVEFLSYPDYEGPIGQVIDAYLHKQHDFSKEVQFLLYFSDFLKNKDTINQWLHEGKIIVADRYFSSTITYQCLPPEISLCSSEASDEGGAKRGLDRFDIGTAIRMSKLFDLPRPDSIILLDISSETSMSRKEKEKEGNLDRHESDKKFLTSLAEFYRQLAAKQIFARWSVVDGEQSIDEVFTEVEKIVKRKMS